VGSSSCGVAGIMTLLQQGIRFSFHVSLRYISTGNKNLTTGMALKPSAKNIGSHPFWFLIVSSHFVGELPNFSLTVTKVELALAKLIRVSICPKVEKGISSAPYPPDVIMVSLTSFG
jgi:hypothetical protein